ncbi:FYVE, RhoGEF and PH domain-containing protein 6-like [Mugil cephalus]|uniref:FYVE, RhoGEF and PH domain-containing protein 6-like n=1 Tax=Mugil cephalus TaxID=48193 RepID=UPI001FB60F77|nr:FYVE, RhoGEF and PH domain-containing protein 6-like [Mugil cephalus]
MSEGMHKPPVAPKPKLAHHQMPPLSPSIPRRPGLSLPSPGTRRKVKPVLAPKPCLSKLTAGVESKPIKSPQRASVAETPRTVGLLTSHNGIRQENKKPDWDYIIPICLCSQENCTCTKSTPADKDKAEKDLKTLHRGKGEEHIKAVPTPRGNPDKGRGNTDKDRCQEVTTPSTCTHLTSHKHFEETLPVDTNLNTDVDTSSPGVTVRPPLPHRKWSNEPNAITVPLNAPGRGPEEDGLGTEQSSVPQPKPVPAVPRKPVPVPVPRKPRTAVRGDQEKVEAKREETVSQEGREINVKEVKVSSEGKGSSSLSVSVPDSENNQPIFLSARRVCAPPAPPPRKKLFLSEPEKEPAPAPHTRKDMKEEEELGWHIYEMEVSVDQGDEEMQKKAADDREAADGDFASHTPSRALLSQLELRQPLAMAVAAEENGPTKVAPKKPQRPSYSMAFIQEKESTEKRERWKSEVHPSQDSAFKDVTAREQPLPLNENPVRNKSSRSSLNKHKAKSFTAADLIRSDRQKRNSFRKLLDLKLSVKMIPKLMSKGGHSPDSTTSDKDQSIHKDQDEYHSPSQCLSVERKLSCPLVGVEQSVDGDEFFPKPKQDSIYENINVYEEITDYINVPKAGASPPASYLQPTSWENTMYNDEGIYEEQEPYMSLSKGTGQHQPTDDDRSSVDEEIAFMNEVRSDDDVEVNSSDEEDEDDSSSFSSKGDHEQPENTDLQKEEKKKNKIYYIAKEIMTSESVFVDVLKLLHIEFRESVSKAQQNGKPVIEERLLNQILYSLPQLYELNQNLLIELSQRVAEWNDNAKLADIFLKKGPYLKMYSTYIREFDKNVALLEEQTKKNQAFGALVREFEASPRCANLALKHYLLKPVQRIPQYQLLLTDYLKSLSKDSADYKDTEAALAIVKEVANHANDIMKHGDNFQKLIQVQYRLNGRHEIVQPGRVFLKEGVLMKLSRKVMQPRMFFLFNDTLLYTKPAQSGQYNLRNMLSLAGMKVSKPSQEALNNELNIESVQRSFILSASSPAERDEWLDALSAAITDYTKKKISFIPGKPADELIVIDSDDRGPLGSKAPIWIPDVRVTMCMICACDFTLTWRRHHCRACGKVVCQSCSSKKHRLAFRKNELSRVCDQCYVTLEQQKTTSATLSPGLRSTFTFHRKQKKIPAALKEVSANTDNSSMSGYLQRSKGKKHGKRLWFVIKDKVLYTYAASEDVAALESQPLLGFVLKVDSSQTLQFKLYHKKTLYYMFKADDKQTAQRWIDSFKEATVL